jgi:hypothetical protein
MKTPNKIVYDMISKNKEMSWKELKKWNQEVKRHTDYLNNGSDTHTYSYEEAERDLKNRGR